MNPGVEVWTSGDIARYIYIYIYINMRTRTHKDVESVFQHRSETEIKVYIFLNCRVIDILDRGERLHALAARMDVGQAGRQEWVEKRRSVPHFKGPVIDWHGVRYRRAGRISRARRYQDASVRGFT